MLARLMPSIDRHNFYLAVLARRRAGLPPRAPAPRAQPRAQGLSCAHAGEGEQRRAAGRRGARRAGRTRAARPPPPRCPCGRRCGGTSWRAPWARLRRCWASTRPAWSGPPAATTLSTSTSPASSSSSSCGAAAAPLPQPPGASEPARARRAQPRLCRSPRPGGAGGAVARPGAPTG